MDYGLSETPIRTLTPPEWAQVVVNDFDTFLSDHASCERKAAALCMSFVAKYGDKPYIVEPMVCLAREELEHFQQVFRIMTKRGIVLAHDVKDPYVNLFLKEMRDPPQDRLLDRLMVSAIIEARGCERFGLLAQNLKDPELADFYFSLARSEAGHFKVFYRIAERYFGKENIQSALERLVACEEKIMLSCEFRPALH